MEFVENNRYCLESLKANIASLGLDKREVYHSSALGAIKDFYSRKRRFDLIFLDPPYHAREAAKKTLQTLDACDILAPNGFVIIEHSRADSLPESLNNLTIFDKRTYGETGLSFYGKINTKFLPAKQAGK